MRRAKAPIELHPLDGTDHFIFADADPRVTLTLRNWLERFYPSRRDSWAARVQSGDPADS